MHGRRCIPTQHVTHGRRTLLAAAGLVDYVLVWLTKLGVAMQRCCQTYLKTLCQAAAGLLDTCLHGLSCQVRRLLWSSAGESLHGNGS